MDHSYCRCVRSRLAHSSTHLHFPCRGPGCDNGGKTTRFGLAFGLMMLVFAASLLAAAVWPYYPFFRMALFDPAYHGELNTCSACYYQAIPWRVMPALIGVPVIILRMRANWRDPLGLMFIMLVAIYTLAAMFQQWTYGRVISYIVLTLQIVPCSRGCSN